MRADKRVLEAGLNNDKIEFQQKIDDIVTTTNFAIKEGDLEGRAFDKELKRRDQLRQKTQKNRRKRAEGVALGAGFPLLFGGGAGSVIGGALGGLTGSFGAQIGLSAIGQQVDNSLQAWWMQARHLQVLVVRLILWLKRACSALMQCSSALKS